MPPLGLSSQLEGSLEATLVTAGIVLLAAAIVGGGLKAFNIEVPGLDSIVRQAMLGTFGAVLLVIGLIGVGSDEPGPPISTSTTVAASSIADPPTTPASELPTAVPTSAAAPATTTTIPPTTGSSATIQATTVVPAGPSVRLPIIAEASGHLHKLLERTEVLELTETVKYRAGVFRGPDMPPAGESWSVFSFDLSVMGSTVMDEVVLDLTPSSVVGDPFTEYGALVITEVSFQDLDLERLLTATEIRELDRLPNFGTRALDVTDAVTEALARGASRFQVRLRFSGSSLEDVDAAIAQDNNFIEWVEGPTLLVTGSG